MTGPSARLTPMSAHAPRLPRLPQAPAGELAAIAPSQGQEKKNLLSESALPKEECDPQEVPRRDRLRQSMVDYVLRNRPYMSTLVEYTARDLHVLAESRIAELFTFGELPVYRVRAMAGKYTAVNEAVATVGP